MSLSKEGFSKSDYHSRDEEGKLHSGVRHSYESKKRLHDVAVNDLGKSYHINMKPAEKDKIHEEIEKHYGLHKTAESLKHLGAGKAYGDK